MADLTRNSEIDGVLQEIHRVEERLGAPMDNNRRRAILNEERNVLMNIVLNLIRVQQNSPFNGLLFIIRSITSRMMHWFGYDPFEWLYFEEHPDHNASFAQHEFANPSLWNALARAGTILENHSSPHLHRSRQNFKASISTATEANELADAIISFCKCLPAAYLENPLLLDVNDVKAILVQTIKAVLNHSKVEERIHESCSSPIITRQGMVAWVHYQFDSETSIEANCCSQDKHIDLTVEKKYFIFPSEADFRRDLRRCETMTNV